ncbi:MAG TPA: hypoxanthine phosphoribosyltransferase [Chloroflexota bacterium]|nr:hypoxanthine phosphoribosyltransferase [Chloroflexota bacterium]
MNDSVARVLISRNALDQRIRELGQQITADYHGKDPVLVGVLKGAVVFMVDLARTINLPIELDFMAVSSYGASTHSTGVVRILKDLDRAIGGRDVLVVEDIVDSGLTLRYIVDNLRDRQPASVRICALLRKQKERAPGPAIDYVGFEIPDAFVVGYGLDYAEQYRNLPYIGVLRPELYEREQV